MTDRLSKETLEGDAGSDLTNALFEQVRPYLKPDKVEVAQQMIVAVTRKVHQGPLPAPEDLEHYGRVVNGGAERIFQMAENEQSHRHHIEDRIVFHEAAMRYIGQFGFLFGLALALSLIGFCAYIQQPIAAGIVATLTTGLIAYLRMSNGESVEAPPPSSKPKPKPRRKR